MENDSIKDMWAEAKASKPKMIFLALILVAAPIGIATQAIKLLDHPAPISASYNDLMKQVYLSGKTTAQKQAEKNSLIGKRIEWTGTVLDANKSLCHFLPLPCHCEYPSMHGLCFWKR